MLLLCSSVEYGCVGNLAVQTTASFPTLTDILINAGPVSVLLCYRNYCIPG